MSKKPLAKAPSYLGVLQKLYDLIHRDYADGGWLPPSREMCKDMDVNRGTYNKAVARLISEGVASSNRKGGTYVVPEHLRISKVGVVMRSAVDCPFIGCGNSVGEVFKYLCDNNQDIQLIQASPISNLYRQAMLHNINTLIWFFPDSLHLSVIRDLEEQGMNVLVIEPYCFHSEEDYQKLNGVNCIRVEAGQGVRLAAEFLLQRGYRKTIYIGHSYEAQSSKIFEIYKNMGVDFTEKDCYSLRNFTPEWLTRIIRRNPVEAIITEGGLSCLENLFSALSKIPGDIKQPAVVSRYNPKLDLLLRRYPQINYVGAIVENRGVLGREGSKMILEHMNNKKPLSSMVIPVCSIKPFQSDVPAT